jgi:hypothetical protein
MSDVYLDAALRGWIVNTAHKEHWRMASWYSVDDLIQDGYVCYCKCRERYKPEQHILRDHKELGCGPTKQHRRWFMALVQAAFYNHIMTLAARSARTREDAVSQIAAESDTFMAAFEKLAPAIAEEASVVAALAKVPAELAEVLERLFTDGFEGGEYIRHKVRSTRARRARGQVRETTREYWERVLGQPDVPELLAAYLQS